VQVVLSVLLHKLICAADPQQHQRVQVVRISLMCLFKSQDREFILVVLLVELA
jgi:hypothetical protein